MINLSDCSLIYFWRPNPKDYKNNELVLILSYCSDLFVSEHVTEVPNNLLHVIESASHKLQTVGFEKLKFEVGEFSKMG